MASVSEAAGEQIVFLRQSYSIATLTLFCAVILAVGYLVLTFDPHRAAPPVVTLDHAQSVEFTVLNTGEELLRQGPVRLSQDWRNDVPVNGRAPSGLVLGVYTISFSLEEVPLEHMSIVIPRVSRTVELVLNGQPVYADVEQDPALSWEWYSPRLVPLPDNALRVGENTLIIRVTASFFATAGLSKLMLGPTALVDDILDRLSFLQTTLPLATNLATLVMAIPLILVWLQGRRMTDHSHFATYGLLAAAMVIFALRSLHVHVENVPLPIAVWVPLVASSLAWAVGFFSVFLLRQSGVTWRLPERVIFGAVVLGTSILFLFPDSYFFENRTLLFYFPVAVIGVGCIAFVCARTAMRPERDQILLALALLCIVPPTINDLAWLGGAMPFETVLLLPIAMPAVLFAISVSIANAYARAWVSAHKTNAELNLRIEAAREELRSSYEARIIAEKKESIAQERAQLIEDLHDGVGNRLSMMLASFKAQNLPGADALHGCLDDLRIIMTARDVDTIGEALSDMCHIHQGAAKALGVEITVECTSQVKGLKLQPAQMLSLLRIGQEALANALRHGKNSKIRAQAMLGDSDDFILRISGAGAALARNRPPENPGGRGLKTMPARVARLGGRLTIDRDYDKGWVVECSIPLATFNNTYNGAQSR
ncbi:sensor histidine kinase [Natronohydrobacter thiooxidans]|uniref:sensor histidine kinase n=1 Tax=Natronohydrobacter thiooxidans TaxID=87172 RepID=UPI0008FF3A72|nr:hypothetical protein [Natronohydrobacter thiooxidans]